MSEISMKFCKLKYLNFVISNRLFVIIACTLCSAFLFSGTVFFVTESNHEDLVFYVGKSQHTEIRNETIFTRSTLRGQYPVDSVSNSLQYKAKIQSFLSDNRMILTIISTMSILMFFAIRLLVNSILLSITIFTLVSLSTSCTLGYAGWAGMSF